jgi:hypothetical protein
VLQLKASAAMRAHYAQNSAMVQLILRVFTDFDAFVEKSNSYFCLD